MSLTQFQFSTRWRLVRSVVNMRLRILSRYPGWSLLDIIMPTFIAAMPISRNSRDGCQIT